MYLGQYILVLITITDNELIYVYNEVKEIRNIVTVFLNTQTPCHARHVENSGDILKNKRKR
jgi:hypothetical protein